MRYDLKRIADAVKKAREYARQYANEPDGGACNFDEAYIPVPSMTKVAAQKLGLRIRDSRFFGRLLMIGGTEGQGARRTRMAEAICKSLKDSGLNASVWYQLD